MSNNDTLLQVSNLKVHFRAKNKATVKAVNDVSFHINRGETFGLVGESGSGKTTIGRSIIHLYEPTSGTIELDKKIISGKLKAKDRDFVTTNMQMIFQDPMSSLNPRKKVLDIVAHGLDIHHDYKDKEERTQKVYEMLDKVGLNRSYVDRYPHQFSGGQRQRIGIARALIMNPQLLIADEAISALDISIQAQVVNLLKDLQKELNTTILFIAHDLAMVRCISDRIGVLHLGHLVEMGTTEDIFDYPVHPYTKSLLSAIPHPDPNIEKTREYVKYDYKSSGIDYEQGTEHWINETHMVLATDQEYFNWLAQI